MSNSNPIPDDIPTVPKASKYDATFSHRVDEPDFGYCDTHDAEFDTYDEYRRHKYTEHPLQCDDCDQIAAYARVGLKRNAVYCAEHADERLEPGYDTRRVRRPANHDAPTLADDHPIERTLQGLEGEHAPEEITREEVEHVLEEIERGP